MAFDLGWNFRATAGFDTDQSFAVPGLAEAYPHTYTNGDGYSINAGWSSSSFLGSADQQASNDARIAGYNQNHITAGGNFRIDLSSGSAPGAGTYTVDLAFGDVNARVGDFQVLDDATVKIDGTFGGNGYSTAGGHYIDATLADVAASTTWTGATASVAFASTTANVLVAQYASGYTTIAHFRLTLQGVSYTLTADSGSFSLGGQAAGLLWAHVLDAASGVFTLSGQDAVLAAARLIAADAGLFTLGGQEAILATGRVLSADAGSFSFDGQDAAFARAYAILAEAGFFTLDGQDVDFVKLTHYLMTADAGLFSLAGQGVTLRYSGAAAGQGQMMRRHHHP